MSHKLQTHETMRAEMTPDVYAGPTCDGVEPQWHGYCEGDKQSEDFREPIKLHAKQYPPGTIVTVSIPCCPKCQLPRQEGRRLRSGAVRYEATCECGFDWDNWVLEAYS